MRIASLVATVALAAPFFANITLAEPTVRPIALAEEGHKHGEGEKKKLGRQQIGSFNVSVIIIGNPHDDKEVEFDVKLIDAKTEPKALRVWIGAEDAKGSVKAELSKKTATYVGDAKVPSPLPSGAKIWVEVETDTGTVKGSYVIEKDDHKH